MQSASPARGFTLNVQTPRTGNVYQYHGYQITLHEPLDTPPGSRTRRHYVQVRHEAACSASTWLPMFTTTSEQLRRAVAEVIEAHECRT